MAYMTRSQLHYKDYDWNAREEGDNPHLRSFPDNVLLARREGYEVLAFINGFAVIHNWHADNASAGNKIERMIRTGLPSNIRGRKAVYDWVISNWSSYSE
jgi:hypothetical protein